ncbi:MAG: molybdate ABC transporter substrate-binding protein [Acidimicrobiaceae bacterium]|nr:molybdate ABC transporter substrate-binding protein [Acidimicrobiaceae bacterium]
MGDRRRGNRGAAVRLAAALVLLPLAVMQLATGCTAGRDGDTARSSDDELGGDLHVLVAASLLPVAEVLAGEFELLHPGLDVQIAGAGSSALREQVLAGAPADVFVPADPVHLDAVRDEVGLTHAPVVVARNSLVLAVPAGNEAGVTSLADLARPELLIGLCAPEVPCGALARNGLARAEIEPVPDSDEPNVRVLTTKLAAGELDAAVVYTTDTASNRQSGSHGGAIVSLGWTAGTAPQASYAAAVLSDAPNPAAATAFVAFMRTDAARRVLADFGFVVP